MDKPDLKSNWTEIKEHLKNKYPKLTEKDLQYEPGKEDKLIDRIGRLLDTSTEETRNILRHIGKQLPRRN